MTSPQPRPELVSAAYSRIQYFKCRLGMVLPPPEDKEESPGRYVDDALSHQNQLLCAQLKRRVLEIDTSAKMVQLKHMVELSDLGGLPSVLDDGLASFVGTMIRGESHA